MYRNHQQPQPHLWVCVCLAGLIFVRAFAVKCQISKPSFLCVSPNKFTYHQNTIYTRSLRSITKYTHTRSHIIRHTCDWEKPPNHYSCWLLFSVPTTILRRRPSAPIVFFINFFLRFVFVFLVFANACLCVSVYDDQRSPAVIFFVLWVQIPSGLLEVASDLQHPENIELSPERTRTYWIYNAFLRHHHSI